MPPADSGYAVGWFTAWDRARLVNVTEMLGVIVSPFAARWNMIAAIAALAVIAIRWKDNPPVAVFATPVIGYLGIGRGYYLDGGRWGSFTVWDQARLKSIDVDQAIAAAAPDGEAMTWVVGFGAAAERIGPVLITRGFAEAARFTGAREENYVLYRRPSHGGMGSGRKPSP